MIGIKPSRREVLRALIERQQQWINGKLQLLAERRAQISNEIHKLRSSVTAKAVDYATKQHQKTLQKLARACKPFGLTPALNLEYNDNSQGQIRIAGELKFSLDQAVVQKFQDEVNAEVRKLQLIDQPIMRDQEALLEQQRALRDRDGIFNLLVNELPPEMAGQLDAIAQAIEEVMSKKAAQAAN